jgi:hypothetical protein
MALEAGGDRKTKATRVCWVTFVNSLTTLVARRLASYLLLRLSRGYVVRHHPRLPSIALTNIDRRPIALELYWIAVLALNSLTPFSDFPYLIASHT